MPLLSVPKHSVPRGCSNSLGQSPTNRWCDVTVWLQTLLPRSVMSPVRPETPRTKHLARAWELPGGVFSEESLPFSEVAESRPSTVH